MLEPSTLESICDFVANNGSLGRWCADKDVRFNNFHGWLYADRERLAVYTRAIEAQKARLESKVTDRMEAMMDADVRLAHDRKGRLLPVHKLPDAVAASVVEVSRSERGGSKLRLVSPKDSTELMGRHLGMFRDRLDVKVEDGVSARLAAARQRVKARK